jgi:hypothetical protein
MSIGMVDIEALKDMKIEDVRSIYKRVTGKGISIKVKNDKQRFIDKLSAIKSI